MSIQEIVDDLVSKYFKTPFKIGDIVKHPSGRQVKIVDGQFMSNGRLSNYWWFREILPDGTLSDKKEGGYGWFPGA